MNTEQKIERIDQLKSEMDSLRPILPDRMNRVLQKLRLDWDYHSNSIEGNTLTLSETRALILYGITAKGKPMRDHIEMKGHNEALKKLESIVQQKLKITENLIKEFHKMILVEPYEGDAEINPGQYKKHPNYLYTPEGERIDFATPEDVPRMMNELINWLNNHLIPPKRSKHKYDLHPLLIASVFHWRFIRIHPFGDGNGRMARILSNLILMQSGYVPAIVKQEKKKEYYRALNMSSAVEIDSLAEFLGDELINSLSIAIKGAKGEDIDDPEDLEKEVAVLQRMQNPPKVKIKKSKEIVQKVLREVYFPLILELQTPISKFNTLFKNHSWTYFEEPEPPKYGVSMMPKFSSLKEMLSYFNSIGQTGRDSYNKFKASYWLLDYNDQTDFSMEIALKVYFSDYNYHIEVFIGQPYQSSRMVQMFLRSVERMTQRKVSIDEFAEFRHFNLPGKEYDEPVLKEEIKDWVNDIAKQTLEVIKLKAIGKIK